MNQPKKPSLLGPNQRKFLDKLCEGRYKEFREQADKAMADTDAARRQMEEYRARQAATS